MVKNKLALGFCIFAGLCVFWGFGVTIVDTSMLGVLTMMKYLLWGILFVLLGFTWKKK